MIFRDGSAGDGTSARGAPASRRGAYGVALVAAVLIVAAHARLIRVSEPVSPSRPHGVLSCALMADRDVPDPYCAPVPRNAPLLALVGTTTSLFGRNYDAVMAAQLILLALTLAVVAFVARAGAGPWAAPIAVILFGLAPMTSAMTTGFDDHLFNALALLIALALTASAGGRPVPILASALVVGIAARYAFLFSNGLLLVATWALALAGSILDRASRSRAGKGVAARTAPTLAATAVSVAVALALLWSAPGEEGISGAGHVRGQIADWVVRAWTQDLAEWTAYPRLAARDLLGPAASVAVALGLYGLHAVRHRSRWTWTAAALVMPLALAFFAKRNGYYLYTSLAAGLAGASVGLWAWATTPARRVAAFVLMPVLLVFSAQGLVLSRRVIPPAEWGRVFESGVYAQGVAPGEPMPRDPKTDAVLDRLRDDYLATGAPEDAVVYVLSHLEIDDLPRFLLLTRFPRFTFRTIDRWDVPDPGGKTILLLACGDALGFHGNDVAAYVDATTRFVERRRRSDAPALERLRALRAEADRWRPLDPKSRFRLFVREGKPPD